MTHRQEKALAALIQAPTVEAAAEAAGIGYSTLRRWLRDDPAFKQAYETTLTELVTDAAKQAKQGLAPALSTLREIVEDAACPPAARVQAARALVDNALKLAEVTDILTRLDDLECVMQDNN